MSSKTLDRNRRALGADPTSHFLPSNAIVMVDPLATAESAGGALPSDLPSDELALDSDEVVRRLERTPSGLAFFVSEEDFQVPGARDLFTKMLQALGVVPGQSTELIELSDSGEWLEGRADFGGNLVVVLGEEAAMRLGILDSAGVRAIVTHSLQALLQQPQFKRECWQHLQLAAREAGWAIPAR